MAHFSQRDVLAVCTCGSLKPLTRLYFCRHCVVLRCGYCVSHEVDSIYCSNCLENLASSEAKLKKNRCGVCFDCPCCFHTLIIRASTVSRVNTSDSGPTPSKAPHKNYYLACLFCRWTSRDAKLPDQTTATSSNWPEHENKFVERFSQLLEYYKIITLRERLEKENRMFLHSSRRTYQHYSEKFGLTAMLARKRAGLPPLHLGRNDTTPPQISPAVASETVESLPDDIFTKPVDLVKLTSLNQRFVITDLQPEYITDLFPVHKQLFIKRSQRCRECLHNIFKPEYGPASIKFKIHLAAYYYVPEIRLIEKIKLTKGKPSEISLKIINPAQIKTNVKFLQFLDVPNENKDEKSESLNPEKNSTTDVAPIANKGVSLVKPRPIKIKTNGKISLPDIVIVLPPRDDTADYDDTVQTDQYQDNPAVVVWRHGNKVIVKFTVTPNEDVQVGDSITVGFLMRYTYHDKIISPLEQKEGKDVSINVRHFLSVGDVHE